MAATLSEDSRGEVVPKICKLCTIRGEGGTRFRVVRKARIPKRGV
jgi:hypothetical protein